MSLIPPPILDDRNDEQLAAEMIGRVTGSLDVTRIDAQILALRKLRDLVDAGALPPAICPELTNANPSSPHTVILEVLAWAMSQQQRKINQLPERDEIEFHRLFGIELREATKATTTLRFTSDGQNDATIPAETEVSTEDGTIVFTTDEELLIPADPDNMTGTVTATRNVAGVTLLSAGTLTKMSDVIAFITAVTNTSAVDSGTDAESVEQALTRARNYQRRAERLVSARDVEDAILEDILLGAGIVKAFPFVRAGDFSALNHLHAGETTVVVMTPTGNPVTDEVKALITDAMEEAIGAQFIYVVDPQYVAFTVEANVKLESLVSQSAVLAAIEKRLRDFYAAKKGNFGRKILRSEIIAIIEGTPGVDRIQSDDDGPIVQSPAADMNVAPYQLPKLNAAPGGVILHVVP
jgi:uncharacterized phage protein gp47/JayE